MSVFVNLNCADVASAEGRGGRLVVIFHFVAIKPDEPVFGAKPHESIRRLPDGIDREVWKTFGNAKLKKITCRLCQKGSNGQKERQ